MKPFIARVRGEETDLLIVDFIIWAGELRAVCIEPGGTLRHVAISDLVAEFGNGDWPAASRFTRPRK